MNSEEELRLLQIKKLRMEFEAIEEEKRRKLARIAKLRQQANDDFRDSLIFAVLLVIATFLVLTFGGK